MPHWVWVVDTTTGHRMDVDKRSLRYGLEPLNDPRYPDRVGPTVQPRRPKHWVGKDGRPAPYVHGQSRFADLEPTDVATDTESSAAPKPPARRGGKSIPAQTPADTTSTKEQQS